MTPVTTTVAERMDARLNIFGKMVIRNSFLISALYFDKIGINIKFITTTSPIQNEPASTWIVRIIGKRSAMMDELINFP
jgi:hypothetical protein